MYDAVIVGGGPNGLAAAITLARKGLSTLVIEAEETVGGGARTAQLTLPGFHHDICSAIHPLGVTSPFFRTVPLSDYGVEWVFPPAPLAHPFDDGTAVVLEQSVAATAQRLGEDGEAYRKLMQPLVDAWEVLMVELLAPMHIFKHPIIAARFGLPAMRSAAGLAKSHFKSAQARGFFVGLSAHSIVPIEWTATASFGLVLGISAHAIGWPCAKGGSQKIIHAMVAYLQSLGGKIETGRRVQSFPELPPARAVLFDLTPRQILQIAGDQFPPTYRRKLEKFRYGPGVFKVDWALDGPIPWKAKECSRAATVHIGATLEEIAKSESEIWKGRVQDKPYVLVAQQSLFDPTRAPDGKHTGWAYCHVPHGSTFDMTERIEAQIERMAPGFRDRILGRHVFSPADYEKHNANFIGGDIAGGANDVRQLLTRPFFRLDPYSTPNEKIFICSSSTPPGGGVHGMCGYHAAQSAIKRIFS